MSVAILIRWLDSRGMKPARRFFPRHAFPILAVLLLPLRVFACPDLGSYYPVGNDWEIVRPRLEALLPECLESSEYFALLGAAQMNTGLMAAAMESLERALLLDPQNGAAQVDYSQALYSAGQLFPALELNGGLLSRTDLPAGVQALVQARQQEWESQTRSRGLSVESAVGYDNNLNGAPYRSSFTLTPSEGPISLTLNPEYQPVSGPYLNLRLSGFYRKLQPEKTHDLIFAFRNRQSEHGASELLQFDWRYGLTLPMRRYQWEIMGGTSHLLYGGSPLYSITEGRARFRRRGDGCRPHYEFAAQHQLYHGQGFMAGLETSAAGGIDCRLMDGTQAFTIDAGVLSNKALKSARPGGDRSGWMLQLTWQVGLGLGTLNSQFSYASLDDDKGYSDILQNGAQRHIDNRLLRLQYTRPIRGDLSLIVNLNHQGQGSNIGPFQNKGTAGDIGFSLNL